MKQSYTPLPSDLSTINQCLDMYETKELKLAFEKGLLNVNDKKFFLQSTSDLEKLQLLVDKGVHINKVDKLGNSALFGANTKKTVFLIKNGILINAVNKHKENALWFAALNTVKELVKAGINVNQRNRKGETVLWELFDISVDSVLNAKIDVNALDNSKRNVLFSEMTDVNDLKKIIYAGININQLDEKGNNALMRSHNHMDSKGSFIYKSDHEDFLNDSWSYLFIENGININQVNKNNENALFFQDYNTIEYLLEAGVSPYQKNNEDLYPLFSHLKTACHKDQNFKIHDRQSQNIFEIIKLYEKNGFDLFTENSKGFNILDVIIDSCNADGSLDAYKNFQPEMLVYLVEKGLLNTTRERNIKPGNDCYNLCLSIYEKILLNTVISHSENSPKMKKRL